MQVRHSEPEVAPRQLFLDLAENCGGRTIDRRNGFGVEYEPPRRMGETIGNPPDPIPHMVDVKKDQAALHEIDGEPGDRHGARFAMQLIESITPRDAAQQGIAWARYPGQKIHTRG